MSMRFLTLVRGTVTANLALFPISAQISAQAQSPAEFYRGETIDLYVGLHRAGGLQDAEGAREQGGGDGQPLEPSRKASRARSDST
jgi:hypothetical protein